MDWFEKLTGFREVDYLTTRSKLEVRDGALISSVNGNRYRIGTLELVSLGELRQRIEQLPVQPGRLRFSVVEGDVRTLHVAPENAGALFQVASQFNLLEMISPDVGPEDGVARYANDPTQGPACAIAAGAATIFRNYFAEVNGQAGQRRDRQLDALAEVGSLLFTRLGQPHDAFWTMRNGYALCKPPGLESINKHLAQTGEAGADELRQALRIGLQWDVEVTLAGSAHNPDVSQAFCSALPISYGSGPRSIWKSFAGLVLEAAYEATLLAALLNAGRGASAAVFLTSLGGGAFGNEEVTIIKALRRALALVRGTTLDVKLVSFGPPSDQMLSVQEEFGMR